MADVTDTRVTLPKVKRPVGRPPKYGAFTGAELALILPVKRDQIVAVLMGQATAIGPSDMVAVELLAGCLSKIELIERYFKACGIFNEENKIRESPYKVYLAALNAAIRMLAQLGMTPESRLKLGIGMIQAKGDLASLMSDIPEDEPA